MGLVTTQVKNEEDENINNKEFFLTVERREGDKVICEVDEAEGLITLPQEAIPKEAREGDICKVLDIFKTDKHADEEVGRQWKVTLAPEETKRRRARLQEKLKILLDDL